MQRRFRGGWDDSHVWDLSAHIAEFVLPRLKRFREINCAFPCSMETIQEWNDIVDDMIYALEYHVKDMVDCKPPSDIDENRLQRGFEAFGKYFCGLWF